MPSTFCPTTRDLTQSSVGRENKAGNMGTKNRMKTEYKRGNQNTDNNQAKHHFYTLSCYQRLHTVRGPREQGREYGDEEKTKDYITHTDELQQKGQKTSITTHLSPTFCSPSRNDHRWNINKLNNKLPLFGIFSTSIQEKFVKFRKIVCDKRERPDHDFHFSLPTWTEGKIDGKRNRMEGMERPTEKEGNIEINEKKQIRRRKDRMKKMGEEISMQENNVMQREAEKGK